MTFRNGEVEPIGLKRDEQFQLNFVRMLLMIWKQCWGKTAPGRVGVKVGTFNK